MRTLFFSIILSVAGLAALNCTKTYTVSPLPSTPTPAFTPSPTPICLDGFGNTNSAWVNQYIANYMLVSPFTNSQNAAVTALKVYSSVAGNAQAGIYAAGASLPTTLIAQTATQDCIIGWNTIPLTTSPNLPPGTYWLAVDTDTTGTCVSTSPGTKNAEAWTFGTLPGTFSSPVGSFPYNMCIQALYYCY